MNSSPKSRTVMLVMGLALLLVLGGGALASWIQTDGGTISIKDVRFIGTGGKLMSALLYIPPGVTNKKPAPGILAIHGYINSRETQDGFAIEFARRGYVVLALDQTGHGFSDPPAFANGFGGPDGLKYLRSLDIVDVNNVGLEGHSMGGWASAVAAGVFPNDYKAIVLEGSSTGTLGAPTGTVTFPHNFGLVFSQWDEFSDLMWLSPVPINIVNTPKLQAAFGSNGPVVPGQVYGSIDAGTARKLYQPRNTHPGDHISPEAIGDAMEWMQLTLKGGNGLAPSNQIWYWKEIGTFIAFIGMVLFMLAFGGFLITSQTFNTLNGSPPAPSKGMSGAIWWISAALFIALPIATFFWLQHVGNDWLQTSPLWAQGITTGIMAWAVGNGLIALVLFLVWHFTSNRKTGAGLSEYGLGRPGSGIDWGSVGKVAAAGHRRDWRRLCAAGDLRLGIQDRLSLVGAGRQADDALQFRIFLGYLLFFTFFFIVQGVVLHGQLRRRAADGTEPSMGREMLVNVVLLVVGFIILLAIQYMPLMLGGVLPLGESLLTIVAWQFIPLLAVVAIVSTYFSARREPSGPARSSTRCLSPGSSSPAPRQQ